MSSGGSAPPAPDYPQAAREQGYANLDAARLAAQLNRVNQRGPTGSTTFAQDPNNPDSWTQTTALSPEQQALYNQRTANQQGVAGLAGTQLSNLSRTLDEPFNVSGPSRISSVAAQPYQTDINAPSVRYSDIDTSGLPSRADADYQRSVDFSGANAIPGQSDFGSERQRVEDALYGRSAGRLDEQFGRADEATRTRLLNQGVREGSEAWTNAMGDFDTAKQDAYGDARDRAIAAGGAEQSRLFADALRARQQGVGEELSSGQFTNDASQLANLYGLNARGQEFGQQQAIGQFGNQAAQQQFQNEATRNAMFNAGQDTRFSQGMANADLANSVRDAGMREQLAVRNQPLQEFLSLYGDGGGGTGVTGASAPGVGGIEPAPIFDAYGRQAQDQMARWQGREAQAASENQMYTGAASTAAMLAALYLMGSDRRMKTDIKRVGSLPNGLPTYRYKYKGEDVSRLGVMSDDVREFMPDAVVVGEDGLDRVNYAMIGALHLLEAN